jgi:hypothetical protein
VKSGMLDLYRVEHGMVIILVVMTCFFGSLATVLELTTEKAIWRREQRTGIHVGAYLLSKVSIYGCVAIIFPLITLGTVLGMSDIDTPLLRGTLFDYWPLLSMGFIASASAGLGLSGFVASRKVVSFNLAIYLAVLYSILQIVFAVFAPLNIVYEKNGQSTQEARAIWLKPASALVTAKWSISGILSSQDLCEDIKISPYTNSAEKIQINQLMTMCQRNYENSGIYPAQSHMDRIDEQWRLQAYIAHLLLSVIALFFAIRFSKIY